MKYYHDNCYKKTWRSFCVLIRSLFWVGVVGAALFAFCCIATHIAMTLDHTIQKYTIWFPDFILGFFDRDLKGLCSEEYTTVVSDIILLLGLLLVSFSFSLLLFKLLSVKRKFKKEWGFESTSIKKTGKDDIKWMLRYYSEADRINIFAGSFDWILINPKLTDLLTRGFNS